MMALRHPLEIVLKAYNKWRNFIQETLLQLGKNSERLWYLNKIYPHPQLSKMELPFQIGTAQNTGPLPCSSQSEAYLPRKVGHLHYSACPQLPIIEVLFWASVAEKWGLPSSIQPPLYHGHSTTENIWALIPLPWLLTQKFYLGRSKPTRPEAAALPLY